MLSLIRSTSILCAAITLCLIRTSFAQVALPFPEDIQKLDAIKSAPRGQDVPLDDLSIAPLNIISVDVEEIEAPSAIEKNVAKSLEALSFDEEIQQQKVQAKLEQFGYDIFTSLPTTFAPVSGIPVPFDYVIGPGDTFKVQVFSSTDLQYILSVTREGMLLLPEVGAIEVSGLTFEESKLLITNALSKLRIGVKSVVTLTDLRTIPVMVVGEVNQPGTYVVSGLSTLINTLITTGGVSRTGSLRDIQVKRGGDVVARFDLYDLLMNGDDSQNVYIKQGDIIFVPPIGMTFGIAGDVHRPAIYELKSSASLGEVIKLAGGLLPTADKSMTQIERITSDGNYTLVQADLTNNGGKETIKNGDLIRVFPVPNKMENVVLLSGHVSNPGGYAWSDKMRLSDLISHSNLRQGTDFKVGLIQREDGFSKRTKAMYFSLDEVLGGRSNVNDLELAPRDQVFIFDTHSARTKMLTGLISKLTNEATYDNPAALFEVKGHVKHPGTYPLERGRRLLAYIGYAGGLKAGADSQYALLVRTDRLNNIEIIKLSLEEAYENPIGDHNPEILPRDRVYIFDFEKNRSEQLAAEIDRLKGQTVTGQSSQIVEVRGSVKFPGIYPLVPGMRVRDLIFAGGGLKEKAFSAAASLSRQITLGGEYSRTDQIDISFIQNDPRVENLNTILRPYDQLVIRQKPEWIDTPKEVVIEGEVRFPGSYRVDKRETLCGLVQRVGGVTDDAYLFGAVFLRESVREKEQKALDRILSQMDDLLADVHMSPGVNKSDKLPTTQGATDTYRIVRELAPQKAVGRLVIDMESVVNRCDETSDIVLENGDRIIVPKYQDEVSVVGQVYFPTSHKYRSDRAVLDYINLSGGTKELAQREHAYIVQANGEVMTVRSPASTWGWLLSPSNVEVTPGATIYVPLSVDRINGREFAQSWVDLIYKLTLSAASIDYLF